MRQLRWGVIGASSKIYRQRLRPAIVDGERHVLVAEASRVGWDDSPYLDVTKRHDVEAVYIPLPNALHKQWILRALEAGKHVLCEKPLTLSAADTIEVYAAANAVGRQVMEAYMWPHHPRARRILTLVADHELGAVRSVRSVFAYIAGDPTDHRFDARGGGALLDIGVYTIGPALLIAERDHVAAGAVAVRNEAGVDVSMTGMIDWGEQLASSFEVSFESPPRRTLEIHGTDGVLTVPGWHVPGKTGPSQIMILGRSGLHTLIEVPGANPFVEMIDHFLFVIEEVEHAVFGQAESIRLATVIDDLHAASR